MKELQELRNEIIMLRNYGGINKEEELSLLSKLNSVKEQLILSGVVSTLPKKFSAAAYTQAITGNYEEFVKWWDER